MMIKLVYPIYTDKVFITLSDIGKFKVQVAKVKIKKINPNIKIKIYKIRLNKNNFKKIIKDYDYIVDGSDNFSTKFLLNDFCYKFKKILVTEL